jgi:hypothetical protein
MAGEVAPQDGVERDAVASVEPGLRQQDRRHLWREPLPALEHHQPVLDRGSQGSVERFEVSGVGHLTRIGDRVDPDHHRPLQLRQPLANARCKR